MGTAGKTMMMAELTMLMVTGTRRARGSTACHCCCRIIATVSIIAATTIAAIVIITHGASASSLGTDGGCLHSC